VKKFLTFHNDLPNFLITFESCNQSLCDIGDVFTIPANIEKTFDQISNAVAHIASHGTMPIILGGDHSIGFPTVRGLASVTSKNM
jgi:agmatinase